MSMIRQKQPFGCGFYSLANVFDEPRFIKFAESFEVSGNGNDVYQLNKYLERHSIGLLPIYQNLIFKMEGTLGSFSDISGDEVMPLLLSKKVTETKNHMVAIHATNNGFRIFDSLKEEPLFVEALDDYIKISDVISIEAFYKVVGDKLSNKPITVNSVENINNILRWTEDI